MDTNEYPAGLSVYNRVLKRSIDILLSIIGLLLTGWIILIAWFLASIDTGSNGLFIQKRIGLSGKEFRIIKIRTMKKNAKISTTVTTANDIRTTRLGKIFRRTKIDELPQLINVLLGHMSFVGPRPDVPGFTDRLEGEDRILLSIRPGITGPATLKYRNEEDMLAQSHDPENLNRYSIFPDKVRINREYIENYNILDDFRYMWMTLSGRTGRISRGDKRRGKAK